ncbi:MAG: triphosphoribosyl-dephospho-CoA synthase [Deltaproteobacteria bacterium]|nr:triphosphoribosyl-dephospho-CoA synthase [Deltaproteobacteria bacterium]
MNQMLSFNLHSSDYPPLSTNVLARAFCGGALSELQLTPKPGLVDQDNSGSHPDLSFEIMQHSVRLLESFYRELLLLEVPTLNMMDLKRIGIAAEQRMHQQCGSNTHRGYIFLSGLTFLAARNQRDVRAEIIQLAQIYFNHQLESSHGQAVRQRFATGGIVDECLHGLPAVFDYALPIYHHAMVQGDPQRAALMMMAGLMQVTEDTTSYHRCGSSGLKQIQADGVYLEKCLNDGVDVILWLRQRNALYQEMNLTMGGVADLMALTFALYELIVTGVCDVSS